MDLTLVVATPQTLSVSHASGLSRDNPTNLLNGDTLDFVKKESDIIEEFEMYFNRLVQSFNGTVRPEFSKVKVVTKKRYEGDIEEENRMKKLNIQIKKSTGAPMGKSV
jgi:hypothetical protein